MFTEEMLRKAAEEANDVFLQYWDIQDDEIPPFSDAFERKMRRLIWKTKHPMVFRTLKSVACFLLAFLIGLGSLVAFNVEARAAFLEWIKTYIPGAVAFRYTGPNEEQDFHHYRPMYLPEGFQEYLVIEEKEHTTTLYQNSEGDRIIFKSIMAEGAFSKNLYSDLYSVERVKIENFSAELYEDDKDHSLNLIWTNDEHCIFEISAKIDREEIVKIAENVKK